jgi:hypothetical protein
MSVLRFELRLLAKDAECSRAQVKALAEDIMLDLFARGARFRKQGIWAEAGLEGRPARTVTFQIEVP